LERRGRPKKRHENVSPHTEPTSVNNQKMPELDKNPDDLKEEGNQVRRAVLAVIWAVVDRWKHIIFRWPASATTKR
jgi:hypothetical protein